MADNLNLTLLDANVPSATGGPTNADGTESGDLIRAQDLTTGIKTPANTALAAIQVAFNALNGQVTTAEGLIAAVQSLSAANQSAAAVNAAAIAINVQEITTIENSLIPGLTLNGTPLLFQPDNTADVSGSTITGLPAAGLIQAFYAYEVTTGGTAFGVNVIAGDFIVATQLNPSLNTSQTGDWVVFSGAQRPSVLTVAQALLLQNFSRVGGRFDWNQNVFVNEANVQASDLPATGVPLALAYSDATTDPAQATARTRLFSNRALQLSNISDAGGVLALTLRTEVNSYSGFAPTLTSIAIEFGGSTFTFPLNQQADLDTIKTLKLTIPAADYSATKNVNANITLNYNYSGAHFDGSVTILALVFSNTGPLHDAVLAIAATEANAVQNALTPRIEALESEVATEEGINNVPRFEERISPLFRLNGREVNANEAYFASSQPANLAAMTRVSPEHSTFTATTTTVYVGVPGSDGKTHILRNTTTSVEQTLTPGAAQGDANLSVVSSFASLFIYEVTGIAVDDVLQVVDATVETLVKWPYDLDNLQQEADTLRSLIDNLAINNLPPGTLDWLLHILITEEANPTLQPTSFNFLSGDGSQPLASIETSPNAFSSGLKTSEEILPDGQTLDGLTGRKIAYAPAFHAASVADVVSAVNSGGTVTQEIVRRNGAVYEASIRIPGHGAGSRTAIRYPSPATRVSGEGIWQDIPTLTFRNGIPVPEADELFFTRNLPPSSRTLTIQYRGIANGNVFGAAQTTLANVGAGAGETATSFVLNDGGETATVEVRWYPNGRIRVSVTERVNAGLPTISSVQVILSWTEQVTTPAQADGLRRVVIADYIPDDTQLFMFAPEDDSSNRDASSTLHIATQNGVWDTQFTYDALFGSNNSGALRIARDAVAPGAPDPIFYNHRGVALREDLAASLFNVRAQPRNGLFRAIQGIQTVAQFSTPVKFPKRSTVTQATRNIDLSDLDEIIEVDTGSGSVALNILTNASLSLPIGFQFEVVATGPNNTTVNAVTGVTLNDVADGSVSVTGWASFIKYSVDEWRVRGDRGSVT